MMYIESNFWFRVCVRDNEPPTGKKKGLKTMTGPGHWNGKYLRVSLYVSYACDKNILTRDNGKIHRPIQN